MNTPNRDALRAAGRLDDDDDVRVAHRLQADQRRAQRKQLQIAATAAVIASGIPHTVAPGGEPIQLRESGKPPVDFFPSTGRARIEKGPLRRFGGAARFLNWYRKL